MAVIQQSPPDRGSALMRYVASVLFAIAVIEAGIKIAADHWPCEFRSKRACTHAAFQAVAQPIQQQATNSGQ